MRFISIGLWPGAVLITVENRSMGAVLFEPRRSCVVTVPALRVGLIIIPFWEIFRTGSAPAGTAGRRLSVSQFAAFFLLEDKEDGAMDHPMIAKCAGSHWLPRWT
jgi:hypothetical protein